MGIAQSLEEKWNSTAGDYSLAKLLHALVSVFSSLLRPHRFF